MYATIELAFSNRVYEALNNSLLCRTYFNPQTSVSRSRAKILSLYVPNPSTIAGLAQRFLDRIRVRRAAVQIQKRWRGHRIRKDTYTMVRLKFTTKKAVEEYAVPRVTCCGDA